MEMNMPEDQNTTQEAQESTEPRLTIKDPIDKDTLVRLRQIQEARLQVGSNILDVEQEKVRLMAMANRIDAEKTQMFDKILTERGLPPNLPIKIDAETGNVSPLQPQGPMPTPQPQAGAPAPAAAPKA